jgi:hypothetical protein
MLQHVTTINSFHNWNTARTSWRARPRLVCKSTQVSSHTCPSLMKVAHPSSGIKARLGSKLGQNLWFNTKHDQIAVSVGWTFNHYNRNLNHGKYSEILWGAESGKSFCLKYETTQPSFHWEITFNLRWHAALSHSQPLLVFSNPGIDRSSERLCAYWHAAAWLFGGRSHCM